MTQRWRIIVILLVLVAGSFWLLNRLSDDPSKQDGTAVREPDYTMSHFTSLKMDAEGRPQNRLTADYLEHFEDEDMTELHNPRFEIFREAREPFHVRADRGWVMDNNEVILLRGGVNFWEESADGERVLNVTTSEAYIYPERDIAETDKLATISARRTHTDSIGMRAWLDEDRIELFEQVRTHIEPRNQE
jgi:lipopolysaccharide export system protein LptC